jgi:hypothetical protein
MKSVTPSVVILSVTMMNVTILIDTEHNRPIPSVTMLSVLMLSAIILCVIKFRSIMKSVVMLSVVMLNVVAPPGDCFIRSRKLIAAKQSSLKA